MVNKIAACMLCFMLMLSVCAVSAETETETTNTTETTTQQGEMIPGRGGMGGGQRPGGMGGQRPEGMPQGEMPQNSGTEGDVTQNPPTPPEGMQMPTDTTQDTITDEAQDTQPQPNDFGGMGGGFRGGMGGGINGGMSGWQDQAAEADSTEITDAQTFTGFVKTYATPILSMVLLALAFVFVIFYKRKRY